MHGQARSLYSNCTPKFPLPSPHAPLFSQSCCQAPGHESVSACGCSLSSCLKSVLRTINCSAASCPLLSVTVRSCYCCCCCCCSVNTGSQKSCLILGLSLKWTLQGFTFVVAAAVSSFSFPLHVKNVIYASRDIKYRRDLCVMPTSWNNTQS